MTRKINIIKNPDGSLFVDTVDVLEDLANLDVAELTKTAETIKAVETRVTDVEAKANTANATANTAKSTAETAKSTADGAKTTANTAKSTADGLNTTVTDMKKKTDALGKTGTATPSIVPTFVGQTFIDITAKKVYVAVGATASDWVAIN